MVNPFISVDQHLENLGWKRYYENEGGFKYVKKIGVDIYYLAEFKGEGIRFYDDMVLGHSYYSIIVNERELEVFAAKIKEWRKYYEHSDKNRKDFG